jgi:hypothetical protein
MYLRGADAAVVVSSIRARTELMMLRVHMLSSLMPDSQRFERLNAGTII